MHEFYFRFSLFLLCFLLFNEIFHDSFERLTYWDFLEDYISKVPEYNKGTDKSLEPNALRKLITHFSPGECFVLVEELYPGKRRTDFYL